MTPRNATRAAIYLRVSLDPTGEGLAVDRQREDCRQIARARKWRVVQEYIDNSISASRKTVRRPAYDRMAADYAAGRFNALVAWDLDRLTRQPRQLEDWIDAAEDRGLVLVTANGEADLSTDAGRLFARIKASVARAEVERKGARQTRAAQQRAQRGIVPAGTRLTGYTTSGELVPSEASVVASVFDDFIRGESLRGIVARLDAEGAATRNSRPWNPSSVRTMLANPRYAGLAAYRGKLTGAAGNWPAIVDEEIFRLVQARLGDPRRRTNRAGTDRRHLGSGLYWCDACDVRVTSWSGGRYRCHACGMTRAMDGVDEAVDVVVCELLTDPRLMEALTPSLTKEVKHLRREAEGLRRRIEVIDEDYDSGVIDGLRYRAARDRVEASLRANLEMQAETFGTPATSQVVASANPTVAYQDASLMIRRAVVDSLVEVRLRRAARGRRAWDPDSISITPKRGR